MTKTIEITFVCQITGFSRYWLEKTESNQELWFCREINNFIYMNNNLYTLINPVYTHSKVRVMNQTYDSTTTNHIIRLPIETDTVSSADFSAYEDKQLILPISSAGTIAAANSWVTFNPTPTPNSPFFAPPSYYGIDPAMSTECKHTETYTYTGLTHTDTFCKKCEVKLNGK